jgi:predicted DNA-binding transcriptional regulator YafY
MLEGAFGIVYDDPVALKVHFSAETARYIKERRWANGQVITDRPDGSVILEMKTSGWFEVKKWILSFGRCVEVLEPQKMREEIRQELLDASVRYREIGLKTSEK